jgi:hypothetical protein
MMEKWKILNWEILDNDLVEFTAEHIETKEIKKCVSARSGWEWGVGELLDISELDYFGQCE